MVTARRIAETFRTVVMVLSDANLATGVHAVPAAQALDARWQAAPLDLAPVPEGQKPYDWDPETGLSRADHPGPAGRRCSRVTGLSHDERSKVAYSSGVHQHGSAMRSRKLAVLQSLLAPPHGLRRRRGRPAGRRVGQHQGRHRGGGRPGARRRPARVVDAPALPLAARARAEGDLRAVQEGDDGRDQLQRRTGRPLHHRREPPTRPARVAAARDDAGGHRLLDAGARRAAAPRPIVDAIRGGMPRGGAA